MDNRLTPGVAEGYNKQPNANAKVAVVSSLGTDFDALLSRGALAALAAAGAWAVVVAASVALEACTSGRIALAHRTGCPPTVHRWLLAAFVALFAGVTTPAAASGPTGPGGHGPDPAAHAFDGLPLPDRTTGAGAPSLDGRVVVVRPGDSLWRIARAALPREVTDSEVAAAVGRLYAANRRTIGADADLITPGQRLRLGPPARPTTTPTREDR